MKVLILGATGGTGRLVVEQALERGHELTAMVRDPASAPDWGGRVRVVQGDVLDVESVKEAVAGQEAVVSALGNRGEKPTGVLPKGMENTVAAMKAQQVRRLVVLSAFGAGESRSGAGFVFNWVIRRFTPLRASFDEKDEMDEVVRKSGLDWTTVMPTRLTESPATGQWRVIERSSSARASIPRADVATFMLDQLDSDEHVGKWVGIIS